MLRVESAGVKSSNSLINSMNNNTVALLFIKLNVMIRSFKILWEGVSNFFFLIYVTVI